MAFDRVKALGEYLAQCANLPNFDELLSQQCGVLAQQIRDGGSLEFAEGAALLALIQQEPHWKESHRHTRVGVVQSKVEKGRGGKPLAGRTPLQDFCWFPVYLTEAEWKIVLDNKATSLPYRTNSVTERCFRLGLKAPSEETYAMCATVLLLPEQERFGDAVSLRSSYITVKDLVKQCLKAKSEEEGNKFEFLKQLPADPRGLEPERLDAAYGPGVRPPARLPEGITTELLQQLKRMIPLRSTNRGLNMPLSKAGMQPMANNLLQPWQMLQNMWMANMSAWSSFMPGLSGVKRGWSDLAALWAATNSCRRHEKAGASFRFLQAQRLYQHLLPHKASFRFLQAKRLYQHLLPHRASFRFLQAKRLYQHLLHLKCQNRFPAAFCSKCPAISKEGSDGHSCDGFHSAISKKGCFGNAKLEQALEARATGKKEEKDAEQKEQTKPKEVSPQPKVAQMKKPAAAGKAASKKRPAAGAVSSGPVMKRPATSKQVASSGTKGPVPPMSTRCGPMAAASADMSRAAQIRAGGSEGMTARRKKTPRSMACAAKTRRRISRKQ